MSFWRYAFTLILGAGCLPAALAEQTFQSGPQQTVMIELYTSEGCNSCPPAESFLNGFVDHKQLWQIYIPLAFHVDYWDYLGWRDAYAKPEHTQRQRHYGKVSRASTIYTPEFFVNGKEWRTGFLRRPPSVTTGQIGLLKAMLKGDQVTASFTPQAQYAKPLELHVALLGMDLHSAIQAGENSGRSTTHQFVVLGHSKVTSDDLQWQTTLPSSGNHQSARRALVVWISEAGNPAPLQATGGFIAP